LVNGKAVRREIRFDSIDLDKVRVRSGLKAGEEVILNPPATLRDGEAVKPRRAQRET
jgi:hypothetical protein